MAATTKPRRRRGTSTQAMSVLVALHNAQNIVTAAKICGIGEQSVREQLRSIEKSLGPGLIVRKGRLVELTEDGHRIARCCGRLLRALNEELVSLGYKALPLPSMPPLTAIGDIVSEPMPWSTAPVPASPLDSATAKVSGKQADQQAKTLAAGEPSQHTVNHTAKACLSSAAPSNAGEAPAASLLHVPGCRTPAASTAKLASQGLPSCLPVDCPDEIREQLRGRIVRNDPSLENFPGAKALLSELGMGTQGDGSLASPFWGCECFRLVWRAPDAKIPVGQDGFNLAIPVAEANFNRLLLRRGHLLASQKRISKESLSGLKVWVWVEPNGRLISDLCEALSAHDARCALRDRIDNAPDIVDAIFVPDLNGAFEMNGWVAKPVQGICVPARLNLVVAPNLVVSDRTFASLGEMTDLPSAPVARPLQAKAFAWLASAIQSRSM